MELSGFWLENIDGAKSEHFFTPGPLRLFYGATGSGKTTLLNGIGRAVKAAEGKPSPPLGQRGRGYSSRCATLFDFDPGVLLDFGKALDSVTLARRRFGTKSFEGFEVPPPVMGEASGEDANLREWERLTSSFERVDDEIETERLETIFEGGVRGPGADPANWPLADWLLLVWIIGTPQFRQRVASKVDLAGEFFRSHGMPATVADFEAANADEGFIAEWNKFRFVTWLGRTLDDPLGEGPSDRVLTRVLEPEMKATEPGVLAGSEEGDDLLVVSEALLNDVLRAAKFAAVEGQGFDLDGVDRWGTLGLAPQWELWVRLSDLSPDMQQVVKTLKVSEEDAEFPSRKILWWLIHQLQRRPADTFINVTEALQSWEGFELHELGFVAEVSEAERYGYMRAVSETKPFWNANTRLVDATHLTALNIEDLLSKIVNDVTRLHDSAYSEAYASLRRHSRADFDYQLPRIVLPGEARPRWQVDKDRWLIPTRDETGVRVRPSLLYACELITERANELAPEFVSEYRSNPHDDDPGQILVGIPGVQYWSSNNASSRVAVGLQRGDDFVELQDLSSGEQRWVSLMVFLAVEQRLSCHFQMPNNWRPKGIPNRGSAEEKEEAQAKIRETIEKVTECEIVPEPVSSPSASTILLLDEPELHLDELKRRVVADWLYERTVAQAHGTKLSIFAATHSVEILTRHLPHQAHQTAVESRAGGKIGVIEIEDDLIGWLKDCGTLLGTAEDAYFRAAMGYLIVEGPHDQDVINYFFREELEKARIHVLPMMGTYQKEAVATSEILARLGKPIYLFFDRIYQPSDRKKSHEMDIGQWIKKRLNEQGVPCDYGGHKFPDIMAALPDEAVKRAFPECDFTSWSDILARYDGPEFKEFVRDDMEWPTYENGHNTISPTEFIKRVLAACGDDEQPHGALAQGIKAATAFISSESTQHR